MNLHKPRERERDMEVEHCNHPHPLTLSKKKAADGEEIVCNRCCRKILGSAYCCRNCSFFLHKVCLKPPTWTRFPQYHHHPLFTLRSTPIKEENDNDDDEEIFCKGCCQKIVGSSAYGCTYCSIYLHKLCAELPNEMTHPLHPKHPLKLLHPQHYRCHCCGKISDAYNYCCSWCSFHLDINCALKTQIVEHKSHKHPLSLVLSSASFECHACGTKHEGISYMCSSCTFWIHEDCASSPTTIKHRGHVHDLKLVYTSFSEDETFSYCCNICKKKLNINFWLYSCKICGYYVHVNCRTKTKFRESNTTIKIEGLDMATLIHLPLLPNESVNLIAQFVKQMNLDDNNREVKLEQFSHSHPLTLCNLDNNDLLSGSELSILNKQNIDKICDVCVQPINASFYNCNKCNFFVHEWCSKLADKFRLVRDEIFNCDGCATKDCIGFQFSPKYWGGGDPRNGYQLDVKCASLPNSIMHKAHEHPLILQEIGGNEGCAACDQSCGRLSFGCGISSCSFNLHCACALLPSIFNHRYDEHPFILTYAPIENGPDEYWCEFCENEVDPEWWFYHCTYCDKSACAKCIRKKEFPNAKLGATHTYTCHPHPLTLIQATYMRVRCNVCNRHIVGGNGAFKCEHCEIMLCKTCVCYRPNKWKLLSDFESDELLIDLN
ncbi:unnamed protein product [Camellia sinensis]